MESNLPLITECSCNYRSVGITQMASACHNGDAVVYYLLKTPNMHCFTIRANTAVVVMDLL